MLMIVLDSTIVNVALPSIQGDLGFSQSSLAWVVNAYLITFGGLLLLAARFVQGIGGALTSAVVLGMIVTMFPEPGDQAKAIGVYAFVASAGGSIGLLAGGAITEAVNWHWIFFVNLPIAILTGAFALRLLRRDRGIGFDQGADVPGAVLIVAGMFGMFFLGALYLQRVLGFGSLEVGLAFLPVTAILGTTITVGQRGTAPRRCSPPPAQNVRGVTPPLPRQRSGRPASPSAGAGVLRGS